MASGLNVEDATGLGSASEGIKTLAGAIMPDPSKVAQAGYYGTKAREALINSAEKTSQMNMMPRFFGAIPGSGVAPVSGSYGPAPGIVNGPYMFTPNSQGSIPAAAPSPLAVMVSGQTQGQAPGPAPGPMGPPLMSPGQAATVMSQPNTPMVNTGSPPPVSPPVPGAAPAPNTTTSNGQVPQNDSQGIHPGTFTQPNDGGVKQSGPAGPNGAPAPITPGIANFMAMGAAAGLPADQMKMIGAAYVSDWIRTGAMDKNTGARTLAEIFDPSRVYHETAETGRTVITQNATTGRTVLEQQGQNYRQGMETVQVRNPQTGQLEVKFRKDLKPGDQGYDSALAVGQQTIAGNQAAATTTYNRTPVYVEEPGKGYVQVPQGELNGRRMVDAKTAEHMNEIIQIVENGVNKSMPRWQAAAKNLPGYDSALAVGLQTIGAAKDTATTTYSRTRQWVPAAGGGYELVLPDEIKGRPVVDAKIAQDAMNIITVATPQGAKEMPTWQAQKEGWAKAPTTTGEVGARAGGAAQAAGTSPGTAVATATAPPNVSDKDIWDQTQNRYGVLDEYYPTSSDLLKRSGLNGVRFRGAAATKLDALVDQLKQASPQTNDRTLYATAVRQLQSTGELPTDAQLARPGILSRLKLGDNSISNADAQGRKYLMVDLQDPSATGPVIDDVEKNPPPPPAPAFTGYGSYTTPGSAQPAQPAQPARPTRPTTTQPTKPAGEPKARVAAGVPNGTQARYTDADGTQKVGIVYDGLVYAQ